MRRHFLALPTRAPEIYSSFRLSNFAPAKLRVALATPKYCAPFVWNPFFSCLADPIKNVEKPGSEHSPKRSHDFGSPNARGEVGLGSSRLAPGPASSPDASISALAPDCLLRRRNLNGDGTPRAVERCHLLIGEPSKPPLPLYCEPSVFLLSRIQSYGKYRAAAQLTCAPGYFGSSLSPGRTLRHTFPLRERTGRR